MSVVLYDAASSNEGRAVRPLRRELNGLWDATVRGDLRRKILHLPARRKRSEARPGSARSLRDQLGREQHARPHHADDRSRRSRAEARFADRRDHLRNAGARFYDRPEFRSEERRACISDWTGARHPSCRTIREDSNTALDHLSELGVTHVELMPVQDFENDETERRLQLGLHHHRFLFAGRHVRHRPERQQPGARIESALKRCTRAASA